MESTATQHSSISSLPTPANILGYKPKAGVFDEMMLPSGDLRPHWRTFGSFLSQCSAPDLQSRLDSIQNLLRDHGVIYNVYDDALGTSRPWSLDLIPFIVAAEEARQVAEGIDQRARLLDLILHDLYGPQTLVKEGWIPPALIGANPSFLRPVVGVAPADGRFVHLMGCDLVRDQGRWRVLADRTQVPFGQGYTLENRIIMANVFAEEFNASRVQRLAEYFETERETLRSLAPGRRGNASIVMLTPGPNDDTYFEHAFKARYLGFPLVESADLTVRDRRVHLKTLEGLRRVDVLVRRLDDSRCDPLELSGDATMGVPGLLESWRSGNVSVANGLGTGIITTPALHPFMPGICRHLLGEELKLPCVPTWWCGQKRELDMVLAEPERWVIKEAFVRGARDPVFLGKLDAKSRAVAVERIKAAPHLWIAQETLALSTTPTWVRDHLEPRPVVWRTYAVSTGDGYSMMPGGLTRVSPQPDSWVVTMRSGGISKDTWVLSDGPVVRKTLLGTQPVVIQPARPPSAVPSRVADHLFWLGRYSERLEQAVRVIRAALHRLSGEGTAVQSRELQGCMSLMSELGILPPGSLMVALRGTIQALLFDPKLATGVPQLIGSVRFNASAARDRLSDDTWRLFNRLERDSRLVGPSMTVPGMLGMLDTVVLDLAAFSGMQQENMTQGHGWRFLELGRRIERALNVAGLVKTATETCVTDDAVLTPLLEVCDSTMTYRRLHFARPQLVPTAYLLLQDAANPRSVAHQLETLFAHAKALPADPGRAIQPSERERVSESMAALATLDLPAMSAKQAMALAQVPKVCDTLIQQLEALSLSITEHYFSHAIRRVR
ncbi:MAG: circularly permuted type 2 ATP-grasp protein [Verrucomicrobiaceae bacterium]|nr:circularly permuted type 2 ATP-grasp protein [Verrucomicrobiaceae bacterium]